MTKKNPPGATGGDQKNPDPNYEGSKATEAEVASCQTLIDKGCCLPPCGANKNPRSSPGPSKGFLLSS